MYIYELNSYINNIDSNTKKEHKYLEIENGQSTMSFYHKASSNINYVVLEIEPELDLKSLKVHYQYHSLSPWIIFSIVFASIIGFIILLFIVCHFIKKRIISKRSYSYEASKAQPLYP